jgi:parallel beta-helix repeat protein
MENNTVNGKEVGYYWDEQNLLIDGTSLGQIVMANCVNVTIENGSLWNSTIAAQVAYSENCTLRNFDIGNVQQGVELAQTQSCTVDLCNFTHVGYRGIIVTGVGDTVSNNILSGVASDYSFFNILGPAIGVDGENIYHNPGSCTIINNTVSNAYLGIHMDSEDCSAINNTVYDCDIGIGATEPGTEILNNTLRENYHALSLRDGCIVYGNYIENVSYFFEWSGGDNTSFCYNTLVNCSWGFAIPGLNCTIVNNTLINTELQLGGSIDAYRHTIEGNTVNGKPLAYIWNATSEVFDLDDYGQLILVNGTDLQVSAKTSINSYAGVHIAHSKDCVVENIDFIDCFGTQVNVRNSDSIMIRNITITESYNSISIFNAVNITVHNNTLMNNEASIRSYYTPDAMIRENLIEDCEWGIYVTGGDNTTIIDNSVIHSSNYGIYIVSSHGVEIFQNSIRENEGEGIIIWHDCDDFAIIENSIINNMLDGISLPMLEWWFPLAVNNGTITNNAIYDNGGYGIYLQEFATNITIYNNGIGWNEGGNARDNDATLSNVWDDGVSQGNWWSDYSGQGNYSISSGNVDRFPRRVLALDSPDDIVFDEDSIGHSIEWITEGPHQNHFEIYINDTFSEANDWTVSPIIVAVDGLNPGVYNFTILLYDSYGHLVNDTVIVTVTPSTVTNTTTSTTPEHGLEIFLIIGISAVIVLIIVILFIKKNR